MDESVTKPVQTPEFRDISLPRGWCGIARHLCEPLLKAWSDPARNIIEVAQQILFRLVTMSLDECTNCSPRLLLFIVWFDHNSLESHLQRSEKREEAVHAIAFRPSTQHPIEDATVGIDLFRDQLSVAWE